MINKKIALLLATSVFIVALLGWRYFTAPPTAVAFGTGSVTHRSTFLDKDFFDAFYNNVSGDEAEFVVSGVVPHHLVAGKGLAKFFTVLQKQQPEVVVLVGPNHKQAGPDPIVSSQGVWRTPYGTIEPANEIIATLEEKGIVAINEQIIDPEHSIGAVVPFIKKAWPNTKIVPLIIKERVTSSTLNRLARELNGLLPSKSILLASVDFSHYLPQPVANFHDVLSENILGTGGIDRLPQSEVDSPASLNVLLSYNQLRQAEAFHALSHTNSAVLTGEPETSETTSHILGYYTAGAPTVTPQITLQFFGDIMIDRSVAKAMGYKGLDYVLEKIRGQENRFFSGVDLFIANLEGPFAPAHVPTSKSIAFRFDPKWAKQFKKYRLDILSLANNHTLDMGRKNVAYTKKVLQENNIAFFGEQFTEDPSLIYVAGKANAVSLPEPVAFIGFETVDHEIDKNKVLQAIANAKTQARYVIAVVHGGTEYRRTSTASQQTLYRWLIDHGVTAVIAHHPHVVEEIEIYKGRPIVYSLGNFIFDQYFSRDTQEGLSVGLVLQNGQVAEIHAFPFYSVKSQVQLMAGKRREEFFEWLNKNSRLNGRKFEDGKLVL